METGQVSLRRGVSWSPGRVGRSFQPLQDVDTPNMDSDASWVKKEQPTLCPNTNQMSKTSLTRSASLSEKELKEARVRSQIIAAQLTIPSNSNSRGVQLFNRRKQRVNAFTLESGGGGSGEDKAEDAKTAPACNKLRWAESSNKETDRELNCRNSGTKPLWSPIVKTQRVGNIMEDPSEHFHEGEQKEGNVNLERHFLPVNEGDELEEEVKFRNEEPRDLGELEGKVKDGFASRGDNTSPAHLEQVEQESAPPGKLVNGGHSSLSGPEKVSVPMPKQMTIMNRTARPFLSPTTVQPTEASPTSPVMDIPPAPCYATPPLPAFTAPQPVAFSAPPPPPSYPTPPLPAFTNQPLPTYSNPSPMSPVMSPQVSSTASQFSTPVPQYVPPDRPMPHHGPPVVSRPTTFIPQPIGERKSTTPIKTGILEEGAAKRANRKSMFTFKEKPVVAPNPELLSLVQGVDQRKKHGQKPVVSEPVSEEELLALGAEASNFQAKVEEKTQVATAPEWASCLKSSRTRPREEHRPEQTLTNASGKGAALFAKRQSRMEKYVLESQNARQTRSPSPTMSLPPSWVYPSNMPGRVKAIAKNSDMSAQLTQTLHVQQTTRKKPSQKAPPLPASIPEPPPLENGCTKIEMDLSRHQPYQINSSLFILNPIRDPIGLLPRGAPPPKAMVSSQPFSRQTSLPTDTPSQFSVQDPRRSAQCMSPQHPFSPTGGRDYPSNCGVAPTHGKPRITSPMSAVSPERVSSPRSDVQAPRPTFSARRAGIEPQINKESSPTPTPSGTPAPSRTPSFTRRFSSPEGPTHGAWSSTLPASKPSSTFHGSRPSVISPVSPPWGSRCQSPMVTHSAQQPPSTTSPVSKPSPAFAATSPLSPLWGSRCASPFVPQTSQPSSATKPQYPPSATSPVSPSRVSRCMSPIVSHLDSKTNHRLLAKNIINAAKRKNSPSPGALSGHALPISPLGASPHHGYDCDGKPPLSPFEQRALGTRSPSSPTQRICSPVRLYNSRSLTDSDASVESEDSGLRSPGPRTYNTCPRGWGGSLRVKRGSVATDL